MHWQAGTRKCKTSWAWRGCCYQVSCSGCGDHQLNFNSSANVTLSKRTAVSLALQVAFVIAGCAHAQYAKVLKQCLGMSSVSIQVFSDTICLLHPVVEEMLKEMCDGWQLGMGNNNI